MATIPQVQTQTLLLAVVIFAAQYTIILAHYDDNEPPFSQKNPTDPARGKNQYLTQGDGECSHDSTCYHSGTPRATDQMTGDQFLENDNEEELSSRLLVIDKFRTDHVFQPKNLNSMLYHTGDKEAASTLQQVYFLHRHGDRTPISFPPKDNLKDEPFWSFHGYGQLTNRGKKRLYVLGEIMRHRYGAFLRKSVNKNHRISRASGSLRCIESAQVFLSRFLELDESQCSDCQPLKWNTNTGSIGSMWQPASILTLSTSIDGMLAESAVCKNLEVEYKVINNSAPIQNMMKEYEHEAQVMLNNYGMELESFYKWSWASSQIEVEQSYFPDKMKPEIMAIYPRLTEAGNIALGGMQSTEKSKRLGLGLLINDMVSNMKKFRDLHHQGKADENSVKKFFHYAGHDVTLILLLGMLDNWDHYSVRPDYTSNIALELHHDNSNDEWFVRFFYMPQVTDPQSAPIEIYLNRCSTGSPRDRCLLDRFEQLMKVYMIKDWQSWMRECNNDLESINPYQTNL